MRPAPADIIPVFLPVGPDHLSCLAPLEIIRVEKRVHENDDVHEGRGEEVEEVADEILHPLKLVAGQPEADAE